MWPGQTVAWTGRFSRVRLAITDLFSDTRAWQRGRACGRKVAANDPPADPGCSDPFSDITDFSRAEPPRAVPGVASARCPGSRAEGFTREYCAMTRRRRLAPRKLSLEVLEPRQLLSHVSDRPLLAAAARHAQTRAELSNMARADLDVNVFATQLVHHPLMAERQGLGARGDDGPARRRWRLRGTAGVPRSTWCSAQHPAYAARHDLTALMATPSATTTLTTLATPTAAATDPASTTTTTSSPAVTNSVSSASAGGSTVASTGSRALIESVARQRRRKVVLCRRGRRARRDRPAGDRGAAPASRTRSRPSRCRRT